MFNLLSIGFHGGDNGGGGDGFNGGDGGEGFHGGSGGRRGDGGKISVIIWLNWNSFH